MITDPLQLYSLAEVASTKGTGTEAILTCKVVDTFYDQPMNFLPQGGGYSEGEVVEVPRNAALADLKPTFHSLPLFHSTIPAACPRRCTETASASSP